jgi:DnaJ-class molecular chaperone
MTTMRDPAFDDYVIKIHEVLDKLDYYRLLGVDRNARIPEVKKAFFAIANKFHPDRNRDADPRIAQAIYDIFKRLNEAYRVLCDHEQRKQYEACVAGGKLRLTFEDRRTAVPRSPEETIQSRDGRQFFIKARDAMKQGNLMQAELHVKMAKSREGENAAIESLAAQIAAAKAEKERQKTGK